MRATGSELVGVGDESLPDLENMLQGHFDPPIYPAG
jgi:hypothetical protein